MATGILYLIPTPLGEEGEPSQVLPESVREIAASLTCFVVERPKSARRFLKQLDTVSPLQDLQMMVLDEHTRDDAVEQLLVPLMAGKDVGLLSEAGCPAVADPGARLVRLAHQRSVVVMPLVGPSSILLALMASGMNGQRFAFHGYLPTERQARREKIAELEKSSAKSDQTEIFIETPYRNTAMFTSLLESCRPTTLLCLAIDVTLGTQSIVTRTIGQWRQQPLPSFEKRPTVFLLYAGR